MENKIFLSTVEMLEKHLELEIKYLKNEMPVDRILSAIADYHEQFQQPNRIKELEAKMADINHVCGTVNYSSHNQMKQAIEAAVELSDNT